MAQQKFTNNAVATLSASINSTATTVTVASGQGALFPTLSAGDYFYATIIDSSNNIEIIKVTARSTDSLTVVRAQEGTTGRSFTGGDNISLRVTAAGLNNFAGQDKDNTFSGANTFSSTVTISGAATVSGTLAVPTQTFGDSDTSAASTAFVQAALAALYPVGSIYTNATVSTNPGTLLGFGTWTAFGAGRVMVGFDSGNALFDTAEETGGSADAITVSHTHTATSTVTDPGHLHLYGNTGSGIGNAGGGQASVTNAAKTVSTTTATTGITVATTNSTEGSSGTNANYQPYITVYMWKRTA